MSIKEFAEAMSEKTAETPALRVLQLLRRIDLAKLQADGDLAGGWYPWEGAELTPSRA